MQYWLKMSQSNWSDNWLSVPDNYFKAMVIAVTSVTKLEVVDYSAMTFPFILAQKSIFLSCVHMNNITPPIFCLHNESLTSSPISLQDVQNHLYSLVCLHKVFMYLIFLWATNSKHHCPTLYTVSPVRWLLGEHSSCIWYSQSILAHPLLYICWTEITCPTVSSAYAIHIFISLLVFHLCYSN